jgi:hypothetical protein
MAYEFGRVDLRVFDFHLSLSALKAADSLTAPMAFLSASDLYRKQFQQPPFTSGDFRIRPLRAKSRLYHHFWKYYTTSFDKLDPWMLLVPFVCEPASKSNKLLIKSPGAGIRAFVRPVTYLFPFGWSNTIEISLQGKMTPAIVQQFVGTLRTSRTGPFEMRGKNLGLPDVFKEYSNQLMKICFVKGTAAADLRRVNRNITMSISRFTGDIAPYKSWGGAGATMAAADKATLHSMLLGEDVTMEQVIAAENGKGANDDRFLLTRYHGAGFAVTYFERGTLLFLQDVANNPKKTNALSCFASNINLSLMMALSLLSFYNYPDTQSADEKTLLGQTRDIAKQQLLAIPARYTNPLCQTWFQYYDPWQKLKPVEKQDK